MLRIFPGILGLCTRLLVLLAIAMPACSGSDNTSVTASAPVDVSADVARIIERHAIPGMVVLVLRGDRVVAQGAAGVRKRGEKVAVQLTDKFEIASCSKPMTAALIGLLVQDGLLRYETTLGELFGRSIPRMKPAWRDVTVRQVLNHRAGFAREPLGLAIRQSLFGSSDVSRQRLAIVKSLLGRDPDTPPGGKFVYTSAAYVVLGAIAEKVTGRPWEELMQERVFGALQMTSAGFGPPRGVGKRDVPWGHGPRFYINPYGWLDNAVPRSPTSYWADAPRVANPAGLMHMTIHDWAKFAVQALRAHPANPHHAVGLLAAHAQAAMMEPLPGTKLPGNWGGGTYAAGWVVSRTRWATGPRPGDEGKILWQQGDNSRWNSAIVLAPEIDMAVLVVCNRAFVWGPSGEVARMLVDRFADGQVCPGNSAAGRWNGCLSGGSFVWDQRLILEVNSLAPGKWNASLTAVDDRKEPPEIRDFAVDDKTVRFRTSTGLQFEGVLSEDGSCLTGLARGDKFTTTIVFKRAPSAPGFGF